MALVIFADHTAVANPDGDLIKIAFTMRAGGKDCAETGTVVLTQWAAMQLAASVYEALKTASRQREAQVINLGKMKARRAKAAAPREA